MKKSILMAALGLLSLNTIAQDTPKEEGFIFTTVKENPITSVKNQNRAGTVFARIFQGAFDFQAIFAGFTGSALMQGIKRGLFSNEAGVGSAPNAAASANVSHPVKQGLVQMLSVFLDTLLICSATALMLLCSGVEPTEAHRSGECRGF